VEIGIIVGATRDGRFGIQPAEFLYKVASAREDMNAHLLDLRDYPMPFFGETPVPGDRTAEWRDAVARMDGYLVVTPEYNHTTSGVLNNAIDMAGQLWFHKPVSFASYGGFAGGARAVEHLRGIFGEMRCFDLREQFVMSNFGAKLNADRVYPFGPDEEAAAKVVLDQLAFWTRHMAPARKELLGS
jgi:NAD(P)H-dependent FMN reductase